MKAICQQCGKEFAHGHSSTGRFCSNICSGLNKSAQHKKEWLEGKLARIERPTLRRYLSEDRGYKCEVCGLSEWQGKEITLQVDHTDGDSSDDSPENVRLICPNCHSQTEFLGAANKGRGRTAQGLPRY